MDLSPGSKLGAYELVGPLGAGGMGEVWRARDTRLDREVALKVLPPELAEHRERRRRFEQEARAASALNHPNIVAVFDIGSEGSASYIAMELVSGKTLRQLLQTGPLPVRRLIDLGFQIASGLARAHAEGIVHRDLKPDNVMITTDGIVKILDFGLAKLVRLPTDPQAGESATATVETEPGLLLGTYGYMSPEQAAGKPIDFRSDQFSFGSILYEMATGQKPFRRESAVDTLSAVLHEEPEPIARSNPKIPAPLRWIVGRCHAKDPRDRYASTEDLARELLTLREHLTDLSAAGSVPIEEPGPRRPPLRTIGLVLAFLALGAGAYVWATRFGRTAPPRFRQLTMQSGAITTARFTSDGQSIVYSTQREGKRPELFETRLDHPESRRLGLPAGQVFSISRSGYLAIGILPPYGMTLRGPMYNLTDRSFLLLYETLAQVSLAGGAPRELIEDVADADWAPNGTDMAIVRFIGNRHRLEYPIGKTLHEEFGGMAFARVSPDGKSVAFSDQGAHLIVVGPDGRPKPLAHGVWEHAWSPAGEIVFVENVKGATRLHALSAKGADRLLATVPGQFTLYDVSSNGDVLLGQVSGGDRVFASIAGEPRDRAVFEDAALEDVSPSGDLVTFTGTAELEDQPTAFLAKNDGSPPKRLGALGGYAGAVLSPDGKFVLGQSSPNALIVLDPERTGLALVPTGVGPAVRIETKGISSPAPIGFTADSRRAFVGGAEAGRLTRLWLVDLAGGSRQPVTPEGLRHYVLSPDGRSVVALGEGGWVLLSTSGGPTAKILGILPGEQPLQWTADSKLLYVRGADELRPGERELSARVYRVDPSTGRRELWKEIPPISPESGGGVGAIRFSADGKTCFYTHHRLTAELFLVEGLK